MIHDTTCVFLILYYGLPVTSNRSCCPLWKNDRFLVAIFRRIAI